MTACSLLVTVLPFSINWYNKSCVKRDTDVVNGFTYLATDNVCGEVKTGEYYPTYAISRALAVEDYVDIYDGEKYNGFTDSVAELAAYKAAVKADDTARENYKLINYTYFTDTTKNLSGNQRVEFMTLAPNSITKVRVYVYLEGQDIDNYDFASLGKQISIKFGFTKERYDKEDIGYQGPDLEVGVDEEEDDDADAGEEE